jgi:hypothetical protein
MSKQIHTTGLTAISLKQRQQQQPPQQQPLHSETTYRPSHETTLTYINSNLSQSSNGNNNRLDSHLPKQKFP